jgi:hypothetical protein
MTQRSRTTARLRALCLVVVAGIALTGCGSDEPSTQKTPGKTQTATPSPSASSDEPTADSTVSGDVQVIKVEKYGISFELPKGWITLNAKNVFKGGTKNPFLDEMADRMGMTQDQLVRMFTTSIQTMSITDQGAKHGFVDNVNTVGEERQVNDDIVKLELATVGAKTGEIEHAASPAGDVTRVPYTLKSKATPLTVRAVALIVQTDDAAVWISISSTTDAAAAKIADQIQDSLKRLPGGGPEA